MTTFNNTIENFKGEVVKAIKCETLKEAKKNARQLRKEFSLIKHAGHVVNYKQGFELFTNY